MEDIQKVHKKVTFFKQKNGNDKKLNIIDGKLTVLEFKYLALYGSNFYIPVK